MTDEARADEGGTGAPPTPGDCNRAPDLTREYKGGGIVVLWYASRCIHSGHCVRSLPRVFDPRRRPWVAPEAGTVDAIEKAVLRCPTGALHYVRTDGKAQEMPDAPTTLTPIRNGPLYVRGDVEVRALDGTPVRRDTRMSLCRCPHTKKSPFCDNSCRQEHGHEPHPPTAPEHT